MMMFTLRSSFVSHHHHHHHHHHHRRLPTIKRTPKTRKRRSPSASNDDLNSNNIEHDDVDDDDDEWYRDVELNVQLVSPDTTKNRRVITIQEQRHNDAVIPVMAKPPLAFLLGMFCAMPIALWEAKRKVRLDARIYGGLDGGSSPATDARASRGPPPPKASPTRTGGEGGGTSASSSSSPSTTPAGPGKRALKASTVAALARVNPEMYLPTPKERSYGNQSMTTTTTTGSNAASNEGIVERKGGRESKVAFSRLVDGARSVIASAGMSTLPTVVMEDIGEENEDVDGMRVNAINSNGTSSSNGRSRRTSRTLIAVKWNPPEHDPFATILVGGNIEQLGSWTPENCVNMKSIGGNKWIADLGHIAAATEINFKFVVESENFGRRAETGEVRNFDVPVLRGGETRFTYVARQAPRW